MMVYEDFIGYFPEFSIKTQAEIEGQINKAALIKNGYKGISDLARRELALAYYVAHLLTIGERRLLGEPGVKKRLSSRNDEVEFAVGDNQLGYGLGSTTYGQELEALLASEIRPNMMF